MGKLFDLDRNSISMCKQNWSRNHSRSCFSITARFVKSCFGIVAPHLVTRWLGLYVKSHSLYARLCVIVTLALLASPVMANEPDLSGTWVYSTFNIVIDGKSVQPESEPLDLKTDDRFEVTRSKTGYLVRLIQEDGNAIGNCELKITESGKNFIGEFTEGEKKASCLIEVTQTGVRAIYDLTNLTVAPADFSLSPNKAEYRLELTFKRTKNWKAESIICVKGPLDAKVSIGDWSDTLKDAPLRIPTETILTDRETPFDVVLQVSSDGKTTKDRIRVWVTGGMESTADFSDISALDKATRTLRYWESSTKTLHRHLKNAEKAVNNAQRRKSLSELTGELRTTPSRGVDIEVVNKWLALVTACDHLQANQKQVEDGDLIGEAILRGLAGDPFGTARDVLQRNKVDVDAFGESFLELKNLAPVLSSKYGNEFPIP